MSLRSKITRRSSYSYLELYLKESRSINNPEVCGIVYSYVELYLKEGCSINNPEVCEIIYILMLSSTFWRAAE